jgi:thiopeptide-type bacteriocin biosynthesis protein
MNWLTFHCYPLDTQDVFLVRALKPFLDQYIWSKKESLAYYVRYQDEKGAYIRLRIKGEPAWLDETIRPAVQGWFTGHGAWAEAVYVREPERFGGDAAMALAESYFHVSTRVVLDRLSRDKFAHGDAMFDALRLQTMVVFGAGFSRDRARWYFEQLKKQWMLMFISDGGPSLEAAITTSFEEQFAPQEEQIRAMVALFWKTLEDEQFDEKQPEWIRWLRGNQLILKELEGNLEKVLPSLIHFTNNRLGISSQDEVYLNYLLSKVL